MDLSKAISAELRNFEVCGDVRLGCYCHRVEAESDAVRPLVLLHSINAAPSAMEMKPLFEHFAASRTVYAPDLPGFGMSQRGDLPYSPDFYAQALADLLQHIEGPPPDVVALSLTSEFAARAVLEKGASVNSLALISPTGLGHRQPPSPSAGARINRFLNISWLGGTLWRALVLKPSIRYFLGQAFYGSAPDELVNYAAETARQPDATYAPFAFLTMQLFTRDAIPSLFAPLAAPTLLIYDQDPNIGFEQVPELLAANPQIRERRIIPTRGLPQWERSGETIEALTRFWRGLE